MEVRQVKNNKLVYVKVTIGTYIDEEMGLKICTKADGLDSVTCNFDGYHIDSVMGKHESALGYIPANCIPDVIQAKLIWDTESWVDNCLEDYFPGYFYVNEEMDHKVLITKTGELVVRILCNKRY